MLNDLSVLNALEGLNAFEANHSIEEADDLDALNVFRALESHVLPKYTAFSNLNVHYEASTLLGLHKLTGYLVCLLVANPSISNSDS